MTVAEVIAEWLHEKEIRMAFGIIGAGNLALWNAIAAKGATEIISTHHEQAAVMAAGFYQRTSGRLSVALVTTGAGSTNAITGVMAAYMDSTPVLVISGNETAASLFGDTRVKGVQGYGSDGVARPFTKDSYCVYAPKKLALNHSLRTAFEPRQGPVWIDIPRDVQVALA